MLGRLEFEGSEKNVILDGGFGINLLVSNYEWCTYPLVHVAHGRTGKLTGSCLTSTVSWRCSNSSPSIISDNPGRKSEQIRCFSTRQVWNQTTAQNTVR